MQEESERVSGEKHDTSPAAIAEVTSYGFRWGPMIVERATSDPKHGVWLHIRTGKELLTVRATWSSGAANIMACLLREPLRRLPQRWAVARNFG